MPELHIIIGCMYSGKSTELLNIIKKYKLLKKNILPINHSSDTRYGNNKIISHDKIETNCIKTERLNDLVTTENYINSEIIIIEEAQFFPDLFDFVMLALYKHNKIIYVAGLDGDYKKFPFGDILKLIPQCDTIKKLSALCLSCNDGTLANFTKRIVENDSQTLIGSIDTYIPVCRYHHNTI